MEFLISQPLLSAPRAGILVLLARLGPYQAVGKICEPLPAEGDFASAPHLYGGAFADEIPTARQISIKVIRPGPKEAVADRKCGVQAVSGEAKLGRMEGHSAETDPILLLGHQ